MIDDGGIEATIVRTVLIYTAWHSGYAPSSQQLVRFWESLHGRPAPKRLGELLSGLVARGLLVVAGHVGPWRVVEATDLGRAWAWMRQGRRPI